MKNKFLLLLLSSGLLFSCSLSKKDDSKQDTPSGDTPAVDPSGGGDEDPGDDPGDDPQEGPVYADITLKFTISGIDSYEGNHSKIWINGDNVDCSKTGYESKVLTQDSENPNLWTVVLENYELEQTLSYNLYHGGETEGEIKWNKGCNTEGDGQHNRTLETFENITVYDGLTATFVLPDGKLDEVKFVMTPVVKETSTAEGSALPEGVVVYAYNDVTDSTTKLIDEGDGKWSLTLTDVPSYSGEGFVQVNPVLGTSQGVNYEKDGEFNKYGMGVYTGSTWEYWKDGDTYTFTSETLTVEKEILFHATPEVPSETYDITFETSVSWLDETETLETTAVYFAGAVHLKDDGVNWNPVKMEKQDDGKFKVSFSDVAPGTYEYKIYACLEEDAFNWQTESIEGSRNLVVSETTTDFIVSSSWNSQPGTAVTSYTLTVIAHRAEETSAWPSSVNLHQGTAESALENTGYKASSSWDDATQGQKVSYTFTQSTVYIFFCAWGLGDSARCIGKTTSTLYAVTFTAETASFDVYVDYNTTDLTFAGVTSNLVGCTIA